MAITIFMKRKSVANLDIEQSLWLKNLLIIGIDEVGRGALSGPMYVGAACLKPAIEDDEIVKLNRMGINDSKQLTKEKREKLYPQIKKILLGFTTVAISVEYINKNGIQNATKKAFQKAAIKLMDKIGKNKYFILLDGYEITKIKHRYCKGQKGIIHGDSLSISIAAASIIAKVERDRYMDKLSLKFPRYKWDKNKGYGTKAHTQALKKLGKTPHHRDLYIRNFLK